MTGYITRILDDKRFKYAVFQQHSPRGGNSLYLGHRACRRGRLKNTADASTAICTGCKEEIAAPVLGLTTELNLDSPASKSSTISYWLAQWLGLGPRELNVTVTWDE